MDRFEVGLSASDRAISACGLAGVQNRQRAVNTDEVDVVTSQMLTKLVEPFVLVQNMLDNEVVACIGISGQ